MAIAAADINRDGILDLITANRYDNSISVLVGNGDGTFRKAFRDPLNPDPHYGGGSSTDGVFSLFVADFDSDGLPDIAAGGGSYGGLFVFQGHGDGTFGAPVGFFAYSSGNALAMADFNGDGLPDFLSNFDCCTQAQSPVSLLAGQLAPWLTVTASASPAEASQPLILTATTSYPTATGTVTFTPNLYINEPLGTAPLVNGQAVLSVIPVPDVLTGDEGIQYSATYSGDAVYGPTSAPYIAVALFKPGPALTITASPNPALPGQQITFTVTVSGFNGNPGVVLFDGTSVLTSQAFSNSPVIFTSTLPAGTHQIRAVYPGYYGAGRSSASVTVQVLPMPGGQLVPGPSVSTGTYMSAVGGPITLLTADFNHDGYADLAVLSPSGKSLLLYLGTAEGYFDNATTGGPLTFTPGAMTYGDGEFLVTDTTDNTVTIQNYYPGGGFIPAQSFAVGMQPVAIAMADFNNDGVPDVITANAGSNDVSLLLSYQGSLAALGNAVYLATGAHPDAVVTGDFNGDGQADFVVADRDADNIMFFAGNGDGTFQSPVAVPTVPGPSIMISADLNGDGKADLAVANASPGQINILLGNGDGTFRSPLTVNAAAGLTAIAATDLTGNGIPSLIVTTATGLLIYDGNFDGTFRQPVNYPQYAGASSVVAAPFGNDSRMDLAICLPATNTVAFLYNSAPSMISLSPASPAVTEGSKVTLTIQMSPSSAAGWVDCFDGVVQVGAAPVTGGRATVSTNAILPGAQKLFCGFIGDPGNNAASTSAVVALNVNPLPSTGFAAAIVQTIENVPVNLLAGDFNNDGIPDFLFERLGNGLIGLESGPGGTYTEHQTGSFGGNHLIAADFNNDGNLDVAADEGPIFVFLGKGDGTFPLESQSQMIASPFIAADVNRDGWMDLIAAGANGAASIDVNKGVGDGTFQTVLNTSISAAPAALAAGDFNEDGIPDVLAAGEITSANIATLDILTGRGDGTFNRSTVSIPIYPVSIAVADFNGDGHQDAAIVYRDLSGGSIVGAANLLTILTGDGDGTFSAPASYALPAPAAEVVTADMNGDGKADLVIEFTTAAPAFAVLYGNGDGTFQRPALVSSTRIPVGLVVADTNNDGRLDVAIAGSLPNYMSPAVEIYRGTALALSLQQGGGQSTALNTAFSQPIVVDAPAGAAVVFSAPASGAGGTFAGGMASATVTANAFGQATAPPFTANGIAGAYVVTASAPGVALSVNIPLSNLAGPAVSVAPSSGSNQTATTGTAFAMPLEVLVSDAKGNPAPNAAVTFSAPASGASGTFAGSGASASAVSNASGLAISPVFSANATAGAYTVSAAIAGSATPAQFNLMNITGVQVTVTTSLLGAQFMVDGNTYSQTQTFLWVAGQTHQLSVATPQTYGSPATSAYVFTGWSDNGAASHSVTVPMSATTITANFKLQYRLTTVAGTGGSIAPVTGFFDTGLVTITATANPGYAFGGFSGALNATLSPAAIDLVNAATVNATFILQASSLQIASSHTGNFAQGQTGAQYMLSISNAANTLPTSGPYSVTETLPAGLTLVSMAGPGWTCAGPSCTRSDVIGSGNITNPITVTVNVAANAPPVVTNRATVSGGGSATASASDVTSIGPLQTISFAPLPPLTFGAAPFTISATATSGLPVSFTSQTSAVCTVAGAIVTIVGGGVCTIVATQAGNSSFGAANAVSQSFAVDPASQTITFAPSPNVPYPANNIPLQATASSGGGIYFSGGNPAVCFVGENSVSFSQPGLCVITATQPGGLNYKSVSVTQSINAGAAQSISFSALPDTMFGLAPIALSATASSGLAVSFSSATPKVCAVSGATVNLISVGVCSVVAMQPGGGTFGAAALVTRSFNVTQGPQSIQFAQPANIYLPAAPFAIAAAATSGLPLTFVSTTLSTCAVGGADVIPLAGGVCTVTASQPGNANYMAATPVTESYTIFPATGGRPTAQVQPDGIVPIYSSSTTIQPGEWVSIYGSNLASSTVTWNGDFPTSLGGTSVTINGKPAYLWFVSPGQINLQAPDDSATGAVQVVVVTTGSGNAVSTVTLGPVAPSFSLLGDGQHAAGEIATPNGGGAYGDGTYDLVGPSGAFPFNTRPVRPGETLILYGVGFGPASPRVPAGRAFSGAATADDTVTITIGGVQATILFAGITEAGLYQFNLSVPVTGSGDQPLEAYIDGVRTPQGPVVTVQ